ncbi:tape measure protein [Chryseobacterium indologenes]|uniref:tape measure protein n=1 Tax=Chryseobacterium indologenes TaxID=253 RepID=UPI003017410F
MANLEISLGAPPEQLGRDLNRASGMLRDFTKQIEKIGEIGDKLSDLGQKLTMYVTLPIVGLGVAAIKAYGDIEALQKGLEAVMGSAARASGEFAKLREVAKLPGLGLKEAAQGSVALQSAGFSAQKSREALLAFGNALATVGKGANEMNFVILALTQLQNKATGFGQDLRQLMEQLPQLRGALQNAFGTSDSEEIAKTGATGAQVVEKLIQEFAKLPKVTGGIKNAFENLKDSIFINLSRIGDAINKNFNINNIIDKLTSALDKLVSAFEDLSPGMQKAIIIVAGLAAVLGPLLVVVGGILASLPLLTAGLSALGTVLTVLIGVMGPELLLLGALAVGIYKYATAAETATDRQGKWSKSLEKATASGQSEVSALDKLYSKTQDLKLSIEERKRAVDDLQKQYPYYFQNIKDEIILAGKAAGSYDALRKSIMRASTARAAQAELDRREETRLKTELALREKLNKVLQVYRNPSASSLQKLNQELPFAENISIGGSMIDQINATPSQVKKAAEKAAFDIIKNIGQVNKTFSKENKPLLDIFKAGTEDINNLDKDLGNTATAAVQGWKQKLEAKLKSLQEALDKAPTKAAAAKIGAQIKAVQKELSSIYPKEIAEKQLAEIFPKGSILELEQRGNLIKKALESTSGDLIRLRKLDIYGKDKDKKGNPIYTGEVISRQQARDRLSEIEKQISELQGKSIQDRANEAEKAFTGYEQMSESFGKNVADKQYASLLNGSKNYLEYLEKEKSKLQEKASLGILTDEQKSDIVFLEQKINSLNGIKSPLEKFKQDVDNALVRIPDLASKIQYLNTLSDSEFQKSGGNTNGFLDRYKYINEQNQKFLQQQKDFYNNFINDTRTFEQKKIDVEKQFNDLRDKINSDSALTSAEKVRLVKETYLSQTEAIEQSMTRIDKAFNDFKKNTIVDSVASTMESIGNAFGNGANIMESVGLSLLSTLGSVMIDLGKLAISTGVGLLAITTALKSLNPYVAIAAGAALVALGSIVKGGVSKIGSSMSSGGGGGGSVSTGTGANYSGSSYSSNYSSGGGYGGGGEVVFRLSGYELKGVLDRVNGKNDRLNANY